MAPKIREIKTMMENRVIKDMLFTSAHNRDFQNILVKVDSDDQSSLESSLKHPKNCTVRHSGLSMAVQLGFAHEQVGSKVFRLNENHRLEPSFRSKKLFRGLGLRRVKFTSPAKCCGQNVAFCRV